MAAVNINHKQFQELIHNEKPLLVDYWAPWCGYCRRIGAAYEKVAQINAENLNVVKVNIDEEPALAEKEHIEVIPTLVIYHKGERLGSITAPESKAAIDAFIRDNLNR